MRFEKMFLSLVLMLSGTNSHASSGTPGHSGEETRRHYAGVENYNFFDIAAVYAGSQGDNTQSESTFGGMARASFEVSKSLYVIGKVSSIDGQTSGGAALGWHRDLGHNVARLFVEAGYGSVLDGSGGTDSGPALGLGFGGHFSRRTEVKIMAKIVSGTDQNHIAFAPTLTSKLSEKTALMMSAEVGGEVSEVNLGARILF